MQTKAVASIQNEDLFLFFNYFEGQALLNVEYKREGHIELQRKNFLQTATERMYKISLNLSYKITVQS